MDDANPPPNKIQEPGPPKVVSTGNNNRIAAENIIENKTVNNTKNTTENNTQNFFNIDPDRQNSNKIQIKPKLSEFVPKVEQIPEDYFDDLAIDLANKKLENSNIVFISATHGKYGMDFVCSLLKHADAIRNRAIKQASYKFSDLSKNNDDKDQVDIVNLLAAIKETDKSLEPTVIVQNITELPQQNKRYFADSVINLCNESSLNSLSNEIAELDSKIIIILSEGLIEHAQNKYDSTDKEIVQVNELKALINLACKNNNKIRDQLNTLLDSELLGADKENKYRVEYLYQLIENGQVEVTIDKYLGDQSIVDSYRSKIETALDIAVKRPDDIDLAKTHGIDEIKIQLYRHIVFIVTHFQDINFQEFNWIMEQLIHDKSVTIVSMKTVEEPIELSKKEKKKNKSRKHKRERKIETIEEHYLLSYYTANKEKLLNSLDISTHKNDGRLVFAQPYMRTVCRNITSSRNPFFIDEIISTSFLEKSLLFKSSESMCEKIADLYVSHLEKWGSSNVVSYSDWIESALTYYSEIINIETVNAPENIKSILKQLLEHILGSDMRADFDRRMIVLLKRCLTSQVVSDLVNDYLQELDDSDRLIYVRKLRGTSGFSLMHWIKVLLSQGSEDIKNDAYQLLITIVSEKYDSNQTASDIHSYLDDWMPKNNKINEMNNQLAAVLLPSGMAFRKISRIKDEQIGQVKVLHPLFDLSNRNGLSDYALRAVTTLTKQYTGDSIDPECRNALTWALTRWHSESLVETDLQKEYDDIVERLRYITRDLELDDKYMVLRQMSLIILLVESSFVLVGDREQSQRNSAVTSLLSLVQASLSVDQLYYVHKCTSEVKQLVGSIPTINSQSRYDICKQIEKHFS